MSLIARPVARKIEEEFQCEEGEDPIVEMEQNLEALTQGIL